MYNHTPVSVTVRAELRQWGEPLRVLSPATEEFVSSVGNVGTYYKGKTEGQGKGDKEVPWYREAADGVISDNGHKALMPVITPRLTGHNARRWSGIIGARWRKNEG